MRFADGRPREEQPKVESIYWSYLGSTESS